MGSALTIQSRDTQYIARISHGKDSLKMLDVIVSRGLPLDRITTTDVWATETIRGEHPKMVEFKARADEYIWRKYHIEVEHLCAMRNGEKVTYEKMFYHIPQRKPPKNAGGGRCKAAGNNPRLPDPVGPVVPGRPQSTRGSRRVFLYKEGRGVRSSSIYGFPVSVNRRGQWCQKLKTKFLGGPTARGGINVTEYLGIAADEPSLARWADTQGFTSDQATTIKEQLKFFSIIPTEASRYETLTGAGLDAAAAKDLTDAMAKLSPEDGKASVSDMQRLRTISGSSLSEREKVAAIGTVIGTEMETESGGKSQYALLNEALERGYTLDEWLDMKDAGLMTESTFKKVSVGADFGVNTDLYIRCREAVEALDDNGSVSQSEATEAISAMLGLSSDQKAVLWQLQNKSWKSKNNPFSPLIGEQVRTAMEDEAKGLSLPTLGGGIPESQAAGDDLPGLSLPTLGG